MCIEISPSPPPPPGRGGKYWLMLLELGEIWKRVEKKGENVKKDERGKIRGKLKLQE
jgi:hypothetical protein